MSDDFWDNLIRAADLGAEGSGSIDSYLSGKDIGGERFESVQALTDAHREANALPLPVDAGTRVEFNGAMGEILAYTDPPEPKARGTVVNVKSAAGEITSHEGKVFVQWDDGHFRAIHAEHLRPVDKKATKKAMNRQQKLLFGELLHLAKSYPGQNPRKAVDLAWRDFEEMEADNIRGTMSPGEEEEHWDLLRDDFRDIRRALERAVSGKKARFKTQDAGSIRVASLGDLTEFLRVANDTLVHKSTKDLWSFRRDGTDYVIERLFDSEGEPLKG
jgi:hypothetical protein